MHFDCSPASRHILASYEDILIYINQGRRAAIQLVTQIVVWDWSARVDLKSQHVDLQGVDEVEFARSDSSVLLEPKDFGDLVHRLQGLANDGYLSQQSTNVFVMQPKFHKALPETEASLLRGSTCG